MSTAGVKVRSMYLAQIKKVSSTLDPMNFFIVVGLLFGFAFLLITPPFQGADEATHFLRAYDISTGHLAVRTQKGAQAGDYLPSSISEAINDVTIPSISFHPNLKYPEGKTLEALRIKNSPKKSFYDLTSSAIYAPVSYAPASFGILIGRILHLPYILLLYAGRVADLLAWIAMIAIAIRFMPIKKWALVFIGLLPMALFQASTLNADVMAIGTVFLFCSYIFYLVSARITLGKKQIVGLAALAIVMALSKEISFIFLPLVLLIRPSQFSVSILKSRLIKTCLIGLPCIAFAGWYLIANHHMNLAGQYSNGAIPSHQLRFILKSPESFINVLWNTYFYSWGDGIVNSLIGTFGWFDAPLSELIVIAAYASLISLLVISYNLEAKLSWITKRTKLLIAGVAVLYAVAVSASLYSYYSPIGFKVIVGLQGRYFIPLLILLLPLVAGKWLVASRKSYLKIATIAPVVLLLCSVITLYVRYFIHNY